MNRNFEEWKSPQITSEKVITYEDNLYKAAWNKLQGHLLFAATKLREEESKDFIRILQIYMRDKQKEIERT